MFQSLIQEAFKPCVGMKLKVNAVHPEVLLLVLLFPVCGPISAFRKWGMR